jgi:NAD(P)-dependent dehydrogenase (short-subunit alcohol dehydrogenase family)
MDLDLGEKVAVITGGSTGIGYAVSRGLAAEGVHVVLAARDGVRTGEAARTLAEEFGVRTAAVPTDVTVAADIDALAAVVEERFGGADILINNAGAGSEETIMEAPDARWQYYWDLHVMAAVRLSRAVVPGMRRRGGGVILNNASICATQPLTHEPIYNVTKAALVMLSKNLASELIGDNIRVNAINPGLVMTAGWIEPARAQAGDAWQTYLHELAQDRAPIGRFATPTEIADFFVFLCSERAAYSVGSTYYVDGGWLGVVT